MSGKPEIGELGTFDVENYGDILYPVIFEKMLRQRGYSRPIYKFSFMGSEGLQGCGYSSRPIRELLSGSGEMPQSLVVGGGDLLRTDWQRIASHYASSRPQPKARAGSLLARLFSKRPRRPADFTAEFRSQYMNYAAVGPFILDPDRFPAVASVAYCSCGVPFPFEKREQPDVASAFGKARFIYVRDGQSKRALVETGVKQDIHVGPDLIVKLSDFLEPAAEREKGQSLLRQAGVAVERPILCFQCCIQLDEVLDELVRQLLAYQQQSGCQIVLLPIGLCHGDYEFLKRVAGKAPGKFTVLPIPSVFETVSILAACGMFLGTSLHGNITAFTFGIPHLFGPIAATKVEGFLEICGLPPELKLNSWADAGQKLHSLAALGPDFFATRAAAARQKVDAVFDLFFHAVIGQSSGSEAARETLGAG